MGNKAVTEAKNHYGDALVDVLLKNGQDAAVVVSACDALPKLCSRNSQAAHRQQIAAQHGAFVALSSCLQIHVGAPRVMRSVCMALEHLMTGKGAAGRRECAVEARLLPLLIEAAHRHQDHVGSQEQDQAGQHEPDPTLARTRAALRSITRDSMKLQQAALDLGAERSWLL